MFKFLHAADVHLDSPLHQLDLYEGAPVDEFRQATRRAFINVIETAISEKVAFILLSGDLYDGDWKDYNTGLFLVKQLAKLKDHGIGAFILAGNHDAANKITKNLRFPENVILFPSSQPTSFQIKKLQVALHGQSYASREVKTDLSRNYPDPVEGFYNIGLLHTCANGREGHEPYAPCTLDQLNAKGYDYWALGHVHQYEVLQTDPPIVFSGNTQGRHIRESGPKGCALVTVEDNGLSKVLFKTMDVVRWGIADIDATDAESAFEVVDRFKGKMEDLVEKNQNMPLALRVNITGETPAHEAMLSDVEKWSNEIRSMAATHGNDKVWVEKIKFNTRLPLSNPLLEPSDGAMGELSGLFEELKNDPEARLNLLSHLSDLDKKIPRELKEGEEGLHFDDPWIKDLLDQIKPMLIKRLIGKEGAP
ncbi:MAG: DNA repair exonuclease [Proteobacteria bacterium]|nr:DNA repair exonuclease [Pseudomonadota bacterium]MBU4472440.1 DNA repair exonuclease [Pseudomonadota bacterium]MCG2751267.1 DNA repair exonuclease [Desulfobacteraceae bacterium]